MGANMAERLRRAGHDVTGFDRDEDSGRDVATLQELVQALPTPRKVWVMVPAGEPTYATGWSWTSRRT
jgi:6-phosphogluconate dehydrogenase